jgi:magnesium chelatase subunit D
MNKSKARATTVYPFTAIVGQERMKLALVLNAINPAIGGALIRGEKGTAKSTAVRALASLLPEFQAVTGCPFACRMEATLGLCARCQDDASTPEESTRRAAVVTLPLGATDDRVVGTLDLERALQEGRRYFEPGLLASAHRGILYVDEVNLLGDHLVDLLLDAAAMGVNLVEREGVSVEHPSRFTLVGTMNPEEGELRPQLLDRFGLAVEIEGVTDPEARAEIVRRRLRFEHDPTAFHAQWQEPEQAERERIQRAQSQVPDVELSDLLLRFITRMCADLAVDGMRADIVIYKASCTLAAYDGRSEVNEADVRLAAELALPHRQRRGPFQSPQLSSDDLEKTMEDAWNNVQPPDSASDDDGDADGAAPDEVFEASQPIKANLPTAPDRRVVEAAGRRTSATTPRSSGPSNRVVPLAASASRSLAVATTLRTAAPQQRNRVVKEGMAIQVGAPDIHVQERSGPAANLTIFVLDSSGSMAAHRRMEVVKSAVIGLLGDAYQKRDRVALVVFRGERAELLLPPTSSVDLAERALKELPTGGRTPLADGLRVAMETVERARDGSEVSVLLVIITDGRGNVSGRSGDAQQATQEIAQQIRAAGIQAFVIDTESSRLRFGQAQELSEMLGANCVRLDELTSGALFAEVQGAISQRGRHFVPKRGRSA